MDHNAPATATPSPGAGDVLCCLLLWPGYRQCSTWHVEYLVTTCPWSSVIWLGRKQCQTVVWHTGTGPCVCWLWCTPLTPHPAGVAGRLGINPIQRTSVFLPAMQIIQKALEVIHVQCWVCCDFIIPTNAEHAVFLGYCHKLVQPSCCG